MAGGTTGARAIESYRTIAILGMEELSDEDRMIAGRPAHRAFLIATHLVAEVFNGIPGRSVPLSKQYVALRRFWQGSTTIFPNRPLHGGNDRRGCGEGAKKV